MRTHLIKTPSYYLSIVESGEAYYYGGGLNRRRGVENSTSYKKLTHQLYSNFYGSGDIKSYAGLFQSIKSWSLKYLDPRIKSQKKTQVRQWKEVDTS